MDGFGPRVRLTAASLFLARAVRAVDGPAASGDAMELEEYLAISRDYEARLDLSKVVIELLSKSYDLFRVRRRPSTVMATSYRFVNTWPHTSYFACTGS